MIKVKIKKIRLISNLIRLQDFLHKMDMKLTYFLIPVFLSLLAASFEGISAGLLIPLARGVIRMDFSFVREMPVFKIILAKISQTFTVSNSTIFILLVGSVFTAAIAKNIFLYLASINVIYRVRKFSHNVRKLLFNRYLSFGKLFFDRSSQGYLHNLLVGFTSTVAQRLLEVHGAFNQFFMLIVYIILMFAISWRLTILLIIISPIFYYSLRWLIEKIKKTS